MAKLKLNIKNLQLSGKSKAAEEKPTAKPASRLKEDATITSALKKAEKTLAARERDKEKEKEAAAPKRKSRLIQEHTEEKKEVPVAPPIESIPQPIVEELPPPPAPIEEKVAPAKVEAPKEVPAKAPPAPTPPPTPAPAAAQAPATEEAPKVIPAKAKEPKLQKKKEEHRFDARDRQGLRDVENEAWRKRRAHKPKRYVQEEVIRPKELHVRLPITIKDLAQEMKLKSSQLVAKLFMQGMTYTLNDYLDDETVVQLLGQEFGCEIQIDTKEQERIQITDRTIRQEIESSPTEQLILRPSVVTFMGHVDHGKTSLIDYIRKSNRVAGEAGAITQHIGAFKVKTAAGELTVIDTPGHEAFSEMRARGANVTDIVILVIAGDEGIRMQTEEAMRQAREAKVPILVALNKADKPNFDAQKVYRELADRDLLPEAWGGTTIVVECSAVTGKGIPDLLEMTALQAEILELRADPNSRARGTVLESEMHKGLGAVATVLVQNGTLRKNDAIVFGPYSGRIKTMHDDHGIAIEAAGPSTPVKITGLSELAVAGSEFIVVKNEKEARELAAARAEGIERHRLTQSKLGSLEKMMAKKESGEMKILPLILRADVQGSLEALKTSLSKIKSDKVRIELVNADVGEISESDVELAGASKSTIVGFHTRIEGHAEDLAKQKNVPVYMQDVIYHLVDEVRNRMRLLLDKIAQESDTGQAEVRTVFKSSQLGNIAGSMVIDGVIKRQSLVRQIRGGKMIWKGKISSLKRIKEDAKEVQKGFDCGIVLEGQSDVREGDIIQAYEVTYLEQNL